MTTTKPTGTGSAASPNARPEDALHAAAPGEKVTFKGCYAQQNMNLAELRSIKARNDKEIKLNDLKKFGDSFQLHPPVPADLVSFLSNNPAKQQEIGEKVIKRLEAEATKRHGEETRRHGEECRAASCKVVAALPNAIDTTPILVSNTNLPTELSDAATYPRTSPTKPAARESRVKGGRASVSLTSLPAEFNTAAPVSNIRIPTELKNASLVKPFSTLAHRPKANVKSTAETLSVRTKIPKVQLLKSLPDANRYALERKLGHIFEDPNILWEALQAHGNGINMIGDRTVEDGNKKLALLGDCVVKMALLNDWFVSGQSRRQGHELSSSIGCNTNLDKCGREAGLEALINPNSRFLNGGRDIPPRTMSATVEALIGAVFVDSHENLRAVKVAMKGLGLLESPKAI